MTEDTGMVLRSVCDGDVVTLTLHRPKQRNALDDSLIAAMQEALEGAAESTARAVVLTGTGGAFCAGADLTEVFSERFTERLFRLMHTIDSIPLPVIAAINGPAIGAGTQLAIAADLRVVMPEAYFQIPAARIGITVDRWTVHRLCAMVGPSRARGMLLGIQQLPASDALACGFANQLGTLADAQRWAQEIAALAPLSLQHLKLTLNDDGTRVPDSPEQWDGLLRAWRSADAQEAQQARAERRQPRFTGR